MTEREKTQRPKNEKNQMDLKEENAQNTNLQILKSKALLF